MSVFNDLQIRRVLNEKLLSIGTQVNGAVEIDMSPAGLTGVSTAKLQVLSGEHSAEPKDQDLTGVESFIVKAPQEMYTPTDCGLSKKKTQYVLWIKTLPEKGVYFNEAVAGMFQIHFGNNQHLLMGDGGVLTILKSYQQATVVGDGKTGRLFNRVFIDTEVYYQTK